MSLTDAVSLLGASRHKFLPTGFLRSFLDGDGRQAVALPEAGTAHIKHKATMRYMGLDEELVLIKDFDIMRS
jgi:hypothetical protein